jgi:hypothetical protein
VQLVEVELVFGLLRVRTVELLLVTVVTMVATVAVPAIGAVFLTVLPHLNHAEPVKYGPFNWSGHSLSTCNKNEYLFQYLSLVHYLSAIFMLQEKLKILTSMYYGYKPQSLK